MSTQTGKCSACQKFGAIQLHHLLARVDHGETDLTVPLCGYCHGLAHASRSRPNNLGELIRRGKLKAARLRTISEYHELVANDMEKVLLNILLAMNAAIAEDGVSNLEKIDRAYVWLLDNWSSENNGPDDLEAMIASLREAVNSGWYEGEQVKQSRQELAETRQAYAASGVAAFVKAIG